MENNKITSKNVTYVLNLIDFFFPPKIIFNFIFTPTCFDFKLNKINNPIYCAGDNEIIDQKLVCLKKKNS